MQIYALQAKHTLVLCNRILMNNLITQPKIENIQSLGSPNSIQVDVLRLDKIHNIVSGNKWYKLKYYLKEAVKKNASTIVTFGGAFSNHIVATAFLSKELDLKCIGIIRGEKVENISHTIIQAMDFGMQIQYVSREMYKDKKIISEKYIDNKFYIIPEGGYGQLGVKGASEILETVSNLDTYTHIICACGTGTMIAGIIEASQSHQKIIGVNVLKGYYELKSDISLLLSSEAKEKQFEILNQYHFGGYAKSPNNLINFMNDFWKKEKIPTDKVYNAKLFYAVKDLINNNYFETNSKILAIHCGGLQGNFSLTPGTLVF